MVAPPKLEPLPPNGLELLLEPLLPNGLELLLGPLLKGLEELLEPLPKGLEEFVPLPFAPWPAPSMPAACSIWSSIGL